jgi:hypothetical protein
MSSEQEEIFSNCDTTSAIATGQHLADLQFDVAEASYQERLDQNYQAFCLSQAGDEAMSRYLGEYLAVVRLDERLRYAGRTLAYTAAIAPLPVGIALAVGLGMASTSILVPSLLAGLWLAAVNH